MIKFDDVTIGQMEILEQARIRLISEGLVSLSVDMEELTDIVFAQNEYANTTTDAVVASMIGGA